MRSLKKDEEKITEILSGDCKISRAARFKDWINQRIIQICSSGRLAI